MEIFCNTTLCHYLISSLILVNQFAFPFSKQIASSSTHSLRIYVVLSNLVFYALIPIPLRL